MTRLLLKLSILAAMLLGLPLAGILVAGRPVSLYTEFPPKTAYVPHAPFSPIAFGLYTAFVLAVAAGFIFLGRHRQPEAAGKGRPGTFPWLGWAGAALTAVAWILAWNRFAWFAPFQPHTFFPLWLGFILVANALGCQRRGRCLLTHRTGFFLALFPASAAFWWFFEYLNRFVQNWYYTGSDYGPGTYFLLATLSFSTVLPAVLAVRDLIQDAAWLRNRFVGVRPLAPRRPRVVAVAALGLSGAGLAGIGVWPDLLFPLLWISPLVILISLQTLMGEPHVLSPAARGDWRPIISAAAAALVCGFFWEMWNFFSLARWTYSVPLVHWFQIFEMPLLGYAGYLPFGLECTALAGLVETLAHRGDSRSPDSPPQA